MMRWNDGSPSGDETNRCGPGLQTLAAINAFLVASKLKPHGHEGRRTRGKSSRIVRLNPLLGQKPLAGAVVETVDQSLLNAGDTLRLC